ncbi:MAG: alanine racemase [Clostridia bacterium]|nr:alanine racemase [Clostridia bacterium]
MSTFLPRTWAEINIDSISHNYHTIKNLLKPEVQMMAVVKADAYGHGVQYIAPELDKLGADWFAVSNLEEAMQLRNLNIVKPILILGYTPPNMAKALSDYNISQTVFDLSYAKALSSYAVENNVTVKIHIKIDTGMGRLGFVYHKLNDTACIDEIYTACTLDNLESEGIFTHFASSDLDGDESGEFTKTQFKLFCTATDELEQKGVSFKLRHCCNSAATLNNPEYQLDMVRPGIILYGMHPSAALKDRADLKPAMCLKSVVSMVKTLSSGDSISYGRTFTVNDNITVATVPVGYADGYPRSLSNKGYVMINGKKANIVGRICMDQMVVDVTDIDNVTASQEILLFGTDDNGTLSVEDFSCLCGTINYETVCIVGKRVSRVFVKNGEKIGYLNYILNTHQ